MKIRGKAEAARSGTGSARPARPAPDGTCGDRWRDGVDHRCPDETRRTTKMLTSAFAVALVGLADGWRRAWSEDGDDGGGGDDDDGTGGGAGAGADVDGADNAAAADDDASQGVRSSVLAE